MSYSSAPGVDGVNKMMGEEHCKTFLLLLCAGVSPGGVS